MLVEHFSALDQFYEALWLPLDFKGGPETEVLLENHQKEEKTGPWNRFKNIVFVILILMLR